mgnify:FL=1
MLLAYVLLWTSFLIIGSVIFFHAVFAALTLIEIILDQVVGALKEKK